jgi:hypothetical protein
VLRWRALLVAAVMGILVVAEPVAAVAATCSTVTVPAYFAAAPSWDAAARGYPTVRRTLVLDPASGPGAQPDVNYRTVVNNARAAGAVVIGYVHTSYGARPSSEVLAEITRYRDWYGVTGIFFDEVSSGAGALGYYRPLSAQVRSARGLVVLNPGVHPDRGYLDLADQVVTFEGTYASYQRARVPSWTADYPVSKFTHLVYGASRGQLASALASAEQRRAGNVYVTNDSGANPWDTLPAYWSAELASLQSRCRA